MRRAVAAVVAGVAVPAGAQTNVYYDGAGGNAVQAGSATWTNGSQTNWKTNPSGNPNPKVNWNNAGNQIANFTASGTSVVTTGSAVTANSLVFTGTGFTLAGTAANAITLTTGRVTASAAATINAVLAGTAGLTKSGTALLTLGGINSFTGTTTVSGGRLQLTGTGTLGATTNAVVVSADGSVANGATAVLDLNGVSATIGSLTLGGTSGAGLVSNTVQTGAGTLTLGGNVTFNGDLGRV